MAYSFKDILRLEVAPALGCTEPVAIALAAAAAASLLDGAPAESVRLKVDPNIYKNGLAVTIPGTGGLSGLDLAAALGAVGGDPTQGMQVLAPVDLEITQAARKLLSQGKVGLELLEKGRGLRVEATVTGGGHEARAVIAGQHDRIISLDRDGVALESHPLLGENSGDGPSHLEQMEVWLKERSVEELLALVDDLDEEDRDHLERSVEYNLRLAEYGLKHGPGLGIGKALDRLVRQRLIRRDMILAARMMASGAADARMAGVRLPAMASAGSGNHGLTAVLPLAAMREFVDCSRQDFLQAVALSHLITGYVKAHTGRLSAVCGCSVAAGAGATAGAAHLLGGNAHHIAGAVKNLTMDLAGVICDGAKAGCALKLATAAGSAVQSALFALQGVFVQPTDGIIGATLEKTTQNIGDLATQGMVETDRTILRIMLEKHFKPE